MLKYTIPIHVRPPHLFRHVLILSFHNPGVFHIDSHLHVSTQYQYIFFLFSPMRDALEVLHTLLESTYHAENRALNN
jgi:hypothetical protein